MAPSPDDPHSATLSERHFQKLERFRAIISRGCISDDDVRIEEEENGNESAPCKDCVLTESERAFCDDACMLRYLRARDWSVRRGAAMLRETLFWRRDFGVEKLRATDPAIRSCIDMGKMYVHGYDAQGRAVCVMRVHTAPDPHENADKLRFMVFTMEMAIRALDARAGVESMTWLVCLDGYNLRYNGDVRFALELLSVLQNHYPERLGHVIMVDAPWVFRMAWNTLWPFINEKTQRKIAFVTRPGEREAISQYFSDLGQVERLFGGDSDYVFDADEYVRALQEQLENRDPRAPFAPFHPRRQAQEAVEK